MKKKPVDQCGEFGLSIDTIEELIKKELPPGATVSDSAKGAFAQASSMFILYVTAAATRVAQSKNRTKISPQDIMAALTYINCERYGGTLKDTLAAYKASLESKKEALQRPMEIEHIDITESD